MPMDQDLGASAVPRDPSVCHQQQRSTGWGETDVLTIRTSMREGTGLENSSAQEPVCFRGP